MGLLVPCSFSTALTVTQFFAHLGLAEATHSLPPGEGRCEGNNQKFTRQTVSKAQRALLTTRSETSETPEADGEGHQGFPLWRNSGWKGGKNRMKRRWRRRRAMRGVGGGRMWRRRGGTESSWEGGPGTGFGKGSGEKLSHVRAAASGPGLLTAQPSQCAPREPPRVPTLLFLNLTRNGLVRLSAL